mgnify:FL=1
MHQHYEYSLSIYYIPHPIYSIHSNLFPQVNLVRLREAHTCTPAPIGVSLEGIRLIGALAPVKYTNMERKSSTYFTVSLTGAEAQTVDACIPVRTFERGTLLLRAGQVAADGYHIIEGCARLYYLIDGEERTTAFFTEGQSVASMTSYANQTPADHYIECVEDCTMLVLNYHQEKRLLQQHPRLESIFRVATEQEYGKNQALLAHYITKSPEERYLHLLETRPELIHRVPQYHLASYLGVKPESLSRIRKRLAKRD